MKQQTNDKRRLRNDVLLIAVLLIMAALGAVYLFLLRGTGSEVTVTVDGQWYGTYSLTKDRVEDIRTSDTAVNRLEICDGKAEVTFATCPDGICAAHAPIYRRGESIVCLPHRVVITVSGTNASEAPDAMVGG